LRFLVDADVLSEPTRARPEPRVLEWLREHERDMAVDPIILGEVRYGILLLSPSARRSKLERWFMQGVARLECVGWEAATGLRWAELIADLRRRGSAMPIKGSMIAATALTHDLVVATRNRADFERAGVEICDPLEA
jgi:predicted nucleic acid-binding protein